MRVTGRIPNSFQLTEYFKDHIDRRVKDLAHERVNKFMEELRKEVLAEALHVVSEFDLMIQRNASLDSTDINLVVVYPEKSEPCSVEERSEKVKDHG